MAYRRLAREVHPDSKVRSTERERSDFSVRMAQLNEAYGVLSDPKQKREYDQQLRVQGMLSASKQVAVAEVKPDAPPAPRERVHYRPKQDVDVVVAEFAKHLRARLLTGNRKAFSWKERNLEGFDWALEAFLWSAHYCVALRGFAEVDPQAIKRFTSYAEVAIAQWNRLIRKSYFLFLLPFEQLSEWEVVSSQCQHLVAPGSGVISSRIPTGILLLDMQYDRTLRFGAQTHNKRFEQLIQFIGVPIT